MWPTIPRNSNPSQSLSSHLQKILFSDKGNRSRVLFPSNLCAKSHHHTQSLIHLLHQIGNFFKDSRKVSSDSPKNTLNISHLFASIKRPPISTGQRHFFSFPLDKTEA
ncbi:hypothetical protein I3842_13G178700 [Carya illinoinensis]|uniref:Uncharacterized protein n=1 Tax=Carya illinoinensis TaxID=32201 RepID=A0A922DEZ2_CARIL|nr:hypothetical protein I3842_13G178700 [Carya illinoinensis]